jgi:hypothetical protein
MIQTPQIDLKISSGTTLSLQLLLHNQSQETLLLHPKLEDWVIDGEQIISPVSYLEPIYIFLAEGEKNSQKMRLQIPPDLQPGQILKSWLRFPGIQEAGIPVQVEIIKSDQDAESVVELFVETDLPFSTEDTQIPGILGLMSGLMDLEKIPMRWLVAEIMVKLCQIGEEYAKSEAGTKLLEQLRPTPFFKNGVSALEQAQFPDWIANTLSIVKSVLKGDKGKSSLLYLWESWWFSLAGVDLERGEIGSIIGMEKHLFLAEEFVTELGKGSDRWFANLILGLAQLSPSIAANLQNLATQTPNISDSLTDRSLQASYNLTTGLSGFDLLSARWLVVEILLLITQKGREYISIEAGSQFLDRLSCTRFFKNGVIAFASAQVPRWLAISQYAANAYYESLGVPSNSRGIFYYWENWLWNLGGMDLNLAKVNNITPSIDIPETLPNQQGMDAEQWFGAIAMGLVQLSPRIATKLQDIAAQAPTPPTKNSRSLITIDDILGEAGSLQR